MGSHRSYFQILRGPSYEEIMHNMRDGKAVCFTVHQEGQAPREAVMYVTGVIERPEAGCRWRIPGRLCDTSAVSPGALAVCIYDDTVIPGENAQPYLAT